MKDNKYQEALDWFMKWEVVVERIKDFNFFNEEREDTPYDVIQELINLNTPMEPKWVQSIYTSEDIKHPYCNACNSPLSNDRELYHRCRNHKCEQLVKW